MTEPPSRAVLITGCSTGIGRETAERLVSAIPGIIDAGADRDARDSVHHGDARDWAKHFGRQEIAAMLDARARAD
jgi:NAD(P)-dependent dehydrogenase (short-subunit alcohol dehydrogenase family)